MQDMGTQALLNDLNQYYLQLIDKLPQLGLGLVLLLGCYFLAGPVSRLLVKPLTYAHTSTLIKVVIRRIISLIIILFGLYLFLKMAGLSTFAVAILSGTGVAGLIIGFAFKDIAENFMSSLLLSIQKPFRIGDVIEVSGYLGIAKQVTARATTLVDFDGNHTQIPNAVVYKNTIRNFTANPKSRGKFIIGIGYDADVDEAQHIGLKVLNDMDAVLTDPEPQVLVDELASSTVNLKVYFWTNTHEYSLLKVASLAMKRIVIAFDDAKISMPDDAREVIFPEGLPLNTGVESPSNKTSEVRPHIKNNANKQQSVHKEGLDDDLTSDDSDIRQQANSARNPEQGNNIL